MRCVCLGARLQRTLRLRHQLPPLMGLSPLSPPPRAPCTLHPAHSHAPHHTAGGKTTLHALGNLEPRGVLFVDPTDEVYEGMVVGEHTR